VTCAASQNKNYFLTFFIDCNKAEHYKNVSTVAALQNSPSRGQTRPFSDRIMQDRQKPTHDTV
ncbi:hypothetical protein, partial [Marinospirillum sp.]|uniref:hypothetical protein n=1 Tax=Marinospirillum sp. TaxID=2183934 RepID=UPI0025C06C40